MKRITNLGDSIDARKDLEKTAIIDAGKRPERHYTYREVHEIANAVACGLVGRRLPRGSRVAIMAENSAEYLFAFFGILRAGLVAVPINLKLPPAMVVSILGHCECSLVFCDEAFRSVLPAGTACIVFGTEFEKFLDRGDFTPVEPVEDEPALILYSSGSTGKPKGSLITHKGHAWIVMRRVVGNFWLGTLQMEVSRQLTVSPFYHMNGLITAEVSCAGHSTIILLPKFDPAEYLRTIDKLQPTSLTAVPPVMAMAIQQKPLIDEVNLRSVTTIHLGSAPLTANLLEEIKRYFPRASGRIFNGYGLTEVGPGLFGTHPDGIKTPELSVGYPRKGIEFRIENGILQIQSPSMMKEYYRDPEMTRASFTPDGYFITGDLFRVDDDGFYYFMGRSDDMFVSGGENIFPSQVEATLEAHPAVASAAVVALPDERKGTKPYAFVRVNEGVRCTESQIQEFALAQAPSYQLPRRVWRLSRIPLNGAGKVDKFYLAELAKELLSSGSSQNELVIGF